MSRFVGSVKLGVSRERAFQNPSIIVRQRAAERMGDTIFAQGTLKRRRAQLLRSPQIVGWVW
jgi:hypothetical protein